jgi:hypothetical protein
MSVYLSVSLSVCPAIRFSIPQRIFSKFGGHIILVMVRTERVLFLCEHTTRAIYYRVNARKQLIMCDATEAISYRNFN